MMNRTCKLLVAGILCACGLFGFGCDPKPAPTPTPSPTHANLLCPDNEAPEEGAEGFYIPYSASLPPLHLAELVAYRDAVGGCNPTQPYLKLANTAAGLRDASGLCTGLHGEELLIWREANIFEAYYAVTIPTGCFATKDRMYKGTLAWEAK